MRLLFTIAAITFSGSSHAGLRGDWQSAGAPIPPYDPPYRFHYRCQAELSDGEERVSKGGELGRGRPFKLYAVQKFELSNGKTFGRLESGTWGWVAKLLDAEDRSKAEIELRKAPKDAFSLQGHSAGLSLARGSSEAEDRVTLSAYVKLPHDGFFVTGSERETSSRAAESIHVRAYASLYKEEGTEGKASYYRTLFVVCDKVK